jgi:hypothetical protein
MAKDNPKQGGQGQYGDEKMQVSSSNAAHKVAAEKESEIANLIRNLARLGGIPMTLNLVTAPRIDTADRLQKKPRVTVAFPPCSDELLSVVKFKNRIDDITVSFDEYFKFRQHVVIGQSQSSLSDPAREFSFQELLDVVDDDLLKCASDSDISTPPVVLASAANPPLTAWPSDCCFCVPCVTLDGNRNAFVPSPTPDPIPTPTHRIRRLFVGDLIWLFYFERMGIFQIIGALLDSYAYKGQFPISNGSLDASIDDDLKAIVLEAMVRQTKMGMSSTVRDRTSAYRTCLGWTTEPGRKLGMDTVVGSGFNTLFHKFIYNALEFYKDKRLAVAIRGTAAPVAPPSVATLISVSDTIDILKRRFEAFDYGRNYYNTLAGIVWILSSMSIIRELRTTLGIPEAFGDPHEYIPAAYDLLVLKRSATQGDVNRYLLHKECAERGRDILLDLEVINHKLNEPGQELENWLTQIEAKVEAYRTAYKSLTNVDIGASPNPVIEQQA